VYIHVKQIPFTTDWCILMLDMPPDMQTSCKHMEQVVTDKQRPQTWMDSSAWLKVRSSEWWTLVNMVMKFQFS